MEDLLQQAGLTDVQAKAYLYLLSNGESAPPTVATALSLTRSNAYKILDKLVTLGLLGRSEVNNKFIYRALDPIALSGIVASERNRLIALENGVKNAISELRRTYETTADKSDVRTYLGKESVKALYIEQARIGQPIRFVKTRADIPVMGYETMDKIRQLPAKVGTERYGITQDREEASANPAIDRKTNLTRTWIESDDYTAPVEWSVSGDELLIISFEQDASAVRIKNQVVANAFKELWQLLDRSIRKDPYYKRLPQQAKRKI